jgi:hypothetical protein
MMNLTNFRINKWSKQFCILATACIFFPILFSDLGCLGKQPKEVPSVTQAQDFDNTTYLPLILNKFPAYYVAADGSDQTGDGSKGNPWATINYAVKAVNDGDTIIVRPGTYQGQIDLRRHFDKGVTIQAEIPYQTRLRHNDAIIACYFCRGITVSGMDISHNGPGAERYLVQIQDVLDNGTGGRNVTLRNNILHDSYNNDILKINNGAQDVLIEGNIFYNQSNLDEHIDITSAFNITIQDNIFFNDFEGSGRPNYNNTAGFILMKDVDGNDDGNLGAHDINIRRNIFLNWAGNDGDGFITMGDNSVHTYYHAYNIFIENNLMLGNETNIIHAALKIVGSRDVIFRNNTVVGNLPAQSFAFRLTSGNLLNKRIQFYNNIWADPTGTMGEESGGWPRFSRSDMTESFSLENNLYWNGDQTIPSDVAEPINYTDDAARIVSDPRLPTDQSSIVVPRWQAANGRFADGSTTIREAFVRLAETYGKLGTGSPAINAAEPGYAPGNDLLGNPRITPDVGAVEFNE